MNTRLQEKGPGGRPVQNPGLLADARALGVSAHHLRMVLSGERHSNTLLARYRFHKGEKLSDADLAVVAAFKRKQQRSRGSMPEAEKIPQSEALAPLLAHNRAAADNARPEVFAVLARLGIEVAIVLFENVTADSPVFVFESVEQQLGDELNQAHCGSYDSTFYFSGETVQHWHFFHVSKGQLAKGLTVLKGGLKKRGLLEIAQILTVDTPNELQTWWPSTAEKIVYKP